MTRRPPPFPRLTPALAPLLAAALGLPALAACDFNLVPELADGAGTEAARISVALGSTNEADMGDEIDGVEVEILDVLVHGLHDRRWYLLNDDGAALSLPSPDRARLAEGTPLPPGEYDRVMVVVRSAHVEARGARRAATLTREVIEIDAPMLLDRDGTLELDFDLDGTIRGSFDAGYTMNPTLLLQPPR